MTVCFRLLSVEFIILAAKVFLISCAASINCNRKINQMGIKNSNSVMGVYCENFSSSTCPAAGIWTEDRNGFVNGDSIPCAKLKNSKAEGKNIVMFISFLVIDGNKKYYEEKSNIHTPLFLTKNFNKNYVVGKFIAQDKVIAVLPEFMPLATESVSAPSVECDSDGTTVVSAAEKMYAEGAKLFCKLSVSCLEARKNIRCDGKLNIVTSTTVFKRSAEVDTTNVGTVNAFAFLKKGETTMFHCAPEGGTFYKWYNNGNEVKRATAKTYSYIHTSGIDTIIQCISNNKNTVWNVFTVEPYSQTKKNKAKDKIVHVDDKAIFECDKENRDNFFPQPVSLWYWEDKDAKSKDTPKFQTVISKVEKVDGKTAFKYITGELTYANDGNFKCYIGNNLNSGTPKGIVGAWFTTDFKVKIQILELVPKPLHWFEYNKTSHADKDTHMGTVYFVKNDAAELRCNVEKDKDRHIWWLIGDVYYRKSDTNNILQMLDSNKMDSLTLVNAKDTWFVEDVTDPVYNGFRISQTIRNPHYKPDILEEAKTQVKCFLFTTTDKVTKYSDFIKKAPGGDTAGEITYKDILIRVFPIVLYPEVRGPLGQIQAAKATITMNCYNAGIPPAYIYWLFSPTTNNQTSINITTPLKATKITETKYHRYRNYRLSDDKDVMIINRLEDVVDEGTFTCHAINRKTQETGTPAQGPSSQVIVEEKCAPGAAFCFNSAHKQGQYHATLVVLMALFHNLLRSFV